MAIKAGQILHSGNNFVIDRIQTGGPGDLNIPQDRIYELGNYQSVGIVRDIPDLTFSLDCLDVDTEIEALLCGSANPSADAPSTAYNLYQSKALDIISPWKSPYGQFAIVRGVAIPNLALESASYRYGLTDNAGEQFSLRGDSIYYIPGVPYQDVKAGDGSTTVFAYDNGPALLYTEAGVQIYALSASVDGVRLTHGSDYTADATGVTFTVAPANGAVVSIVYGSTATESLAQTVHEGLAVKPAAIRGKNINVYFATIVKVGGGVTNKALASNVASLTTASAHGISVGDSFTVNIGDPVFDGDHVATSGTTGTTLHFAKTHADITGTSVSGTATVSRSVEVRWPDVQAVNIDWRATVESDFEFGNSHAVNRDYTTVPDVTGSVELKPRSVQAFFDRLTQLTGVPVGDIIGPQSSVAGALRVELTNPDSGGTTAVPPGTVLKTHYVPACRFTIPGYSGQPQQKITVTCNFESDDGVLETFKGVRA